MAGVNETPRQKMMGILYLVLLGLAATTITEKVLDAFRNLTVGLENSTNNVQSTIDQTFAAFEAGKLKNEPERARPIWERAKKVKEAVENLDKYIRETKAKLEEDGHYFDSSAGDFKGREDVDISPRVMIVHHRADTLRAMIDSTKARILAELDAKGRANFKMALNANDPARSRDGVARSWQDNFFGDGIPLTAAFTALTKIQADLRNTESEAIKNILGEVDKAVMNLDQFSAVAVPTSSTYVLLGQPYTAEVYLTAFDSKTNPDMSVGGQKLNVAGGKGTYTVSTSREGEFKWFAMISAKKADGTTATYKSDELTYRVAKPSAVVSPDKMNVFYVGVDNPVSVSAPGTPDDKLHVSISGGGGVITGAKGHYIVTVKQTGPVKITITGDGDKGKNSVLGTADFRCKRIPTPHVRFGGKSGGSVAKALLTGQDRVFANLEDFDFATTFNINHFTLYIIKPRSDVQTFEANTNTLTAPMKAAMSSIIPGTRVMFDNVFATGPDGMRRPLDPITFTAQ